ncbi:osmoprotectant transport system permease protein [Thermocatellispora tengchongensis]|uniref:Osmoprotectant transport system permease protein n=1 Tax=Thermocatellispora tengchongensis TaxID=1073253 RepID=A0A840P2B8_9ACTN|nr:ABC transporter permease [Thermocatellispora tengchongensis]MBB5132636.1 osmoprotectant transport system permease protein [Thermocatellispora tengchongensis]
MDEEPLVRWDWIARNWSTGRVGSISSLLVDHIVMSGLPIVLGLLAALPIGLACVRWRRLYQPTAGVMNVIYALPSLPVFMFLLPLTGLTKATVIIPLTFYAVAVLIPAVVDGMTAIPDHVRQSAVAMGFNPLRRLLQVDLVLAMPVVLAGLRVVAVSSISLVSVGALIGQGGLGNLFTDAFKRDFPTPAVVGIALIVALALVADGALVFLQRMLTPWARVRRSA